MQPTIIGVLGKPLSGKDTVIKAIRESDPSVAVISFGTILSEVKVLKESHRFWPMLKDAVSIAESGGIVPGDPINACMGQLITEAMYAGKTRIVWSAGPRNEEELHWLDAFSKQHNLKEQFLYVDVPDEEVYRRRNGRNEGRLDDREEVVPVRLKNFEEITKPVIDRLRKEGRLTEISGIGSKETIASRAIEALDLKLRDPEITLPPMARR